ncbi:MAG: DUF1016 domain-containing protein [Acidobacteria bacterium]|nr:DUF1016 domain-containing protein [Acidobacteriota bacterium]
MTKALKKKTKVANRTRSKSLTTSRRAARLESLEVGNLYVEVRDILNEARTRIARQVNSEMVRAYWLIGQAIVEYEQRGKNRAEYGEQLIESLSARLTEEFGKGFDRSNLWHMRKFHLTFPNFLDALRRELSWTHYRLLLKVENADARDFYATEAAEANWSTRQLERQLNSLFYERVALSRQKRALLKESREQAEKQTPLDFIKDPFVLEFLGLPEAHSLSESELETALLDHLQQFLLELGKGFSFIARQQRITLDGDHFYIDLVFYNRLLRCFVLVDLKIGRLTHGDLGQIQMYTNFYTRERREEWENPAIGILLCAEKNDAVVRYTLAEEQAQIFASRYQLYLPTAEELRVELQHEQQHFASRRRFAKEE